ncbi:MAG: tyrosine-type recombinase/integrase [Allosphingosinicella sp.]
MLVEERARRRADERPSEAELQAIAKAEFQNQLARYCDMQRQHPRHRAMHSAANRAYADYYQRMIDTGGRPIFATGEEQELLAAGYPLERLERLKVVIEQHHNGGQPAIKPGTCAFHLRRLGFEPSRFLDAIVERALYPAYRDACLEAEAALMPPPAREPPPPREEPVVATAVETPPTVAAMGPSLGELAALAAKDLRTDGRWDDKLCRQVKSTVAVFELLMGVKPFASRTQEDLASFKRKLRLVPKRYDMTSEKSRQIVLAAAEGRPTGLPEAELGLAPPTINRHITALRVIHRWARTAGVAAPTWLFDNLHIDVSKKKRDRNQRPATSLDDLRKLFALPIFTGCQPHRGGTGQVVLRARFTPGPAIVHDAFYWVPLLTYYDGARREENCKLRPDDFRQLDGIHYIQIDYTETGRIKNEGSIRAVPLHRELIRLGILEFVDVRRREGRDVLFPELRPTNETQKFGDVFYKRCWVNIRAKGGLSPLADIHGARHRFSTALKDQRVESEFRADLMGHLGKTITEERYSDPAELKLLQAMVDQLPSITHHLAKGPSLQPSSRGRR